MGEPENHRKVGIYAGTVGGALLIVTADDYGYSQRYNLGILAAARAGALDSVGAMVTRAWCDPAPLLRTGVEVGLHLTRDAPLEGQLELFRRLFGGRPACIDGHHHCHADPDLAPGVNQAALKLGIPVRSVSDEHRDLLRGMGIRTTDRLVGRLGPHEPARPAILDALPPGSTEWMVHPGLPDPALGSAYDEAREEDLELVLGRPTIQGDDGVPVRRATHAAL
jgi:predicted glycoside hydrolase/deacetylase ChbG (UPF0249 family)